MVFEVELVDFKPVTEQEQEEMQLTPEQLRQLQQQGYSGSGDEEDENFYLDEDETIDYDQ